MVRTCVECETVRLGEISCDDARVKCGDMETSITLFVGEVIRQSSVITLTEDVDVDAHDYGAPTLRRIATRAVAGLCKRATSERHRSARCNSEFSR